MVRRASAARDVIPTLRAAGGRTYLFLPDGRMGRLLITDAERLQERAVAQFKIQNSKFKIRISENIKPRGSALSCALYLCFI